MQWDDFAIKVVKLVTKISYLVAKLQLDFFVNFKPCAHFLYKNNSISIGYINNEMCSGLRSMSMLTGGYLFPLFCEPIECFHMTSQRPCSKTKEWRP